MQSAKKHKGSILNNTTDNFQIILAITIILIDNGPIFKMNAKKRTVNYQLLSAAWNGKLKL